MRRIQVLDQHECHAGSGRQVLQKLRKRLQATRRSAHADDGEASPDALGIVQLAGRSPAAWRKRGSGLRSGGGRFAGCLAGRFAATLYGHTQFSMRYSGSAPEAGGFRTALGLPRADTIKTYLTVIQKNIL